VQDGQSDRWDQRNENREDWQDHMNDAREDRQDHWENVDWDEVHIYDDDEFEWNSGTWLVLGVGTVITYSAWQSMNAQPSCNLYQVEVEGTLYYRCGSTWYIEAVTGGEVRYVAVEPPPGY
jgi:hypothetical protein